MILQNKRYLQKRDLLFFLITAYGTAKVKFCAFKIGCTAGKVDVFGMKICFVPTNPDVYFEYASKCDKGGLFFISHAWKNQNFNLILPRNKLFDM